MISSDSKIAQGCRTPNAAVETFTIMKILIRAGKSSVTSAAASSSEEGKKNFPSFKKQRLKEVRCSRSLGIWDQIWDSRVHRGYFLPHCKPHSLRVRL